METPGSPMPILTWAVAEVIEPTINPNAINPLRNTCLIFMLSVGPGEPLIRKLDAGLTAVSAEAHTPMVLTHGFG